MKKTLLTLIVVLTATTGSYAQLKKYNILNHLAIGLDVGTTGIGADVAVPFTKYLEIEAGFSIMPKIKYNTKLHLNLSQYWDMTNGQLDLGLSDIPIQGKLNMVNGKVMFNVYPIAALNSFHITVGAFFGKESVVEVYNTQDGQLAIVNQANEAIDAYNEIATANNLMPQEHIGVKLGDYLLTPDANGNIKATLNTKSFKPYVGIGYGSAVPKRRLGFKVDLGAMFWGTPDVVDHNGVSLSKQDWGGKDGGAFRIINKIKVYPVLNFRLSGRIF